MTFVASVGYFSSISPSRSISCFDSCGIVTENTDHPWNSNTSGISTNPVMEPQKASQFRPYQSGNFRACAKYSCSASLPCTLRRSIVTICGRVIPECPGAQPQSGPVVDAAPATRAQLRRSISRRTPSEAGRHPPTCSTQWHWTAAVDPA